VTFDQPAWLILLVLLPLLGLGAVVTAQLRRKQWSAFAAPRLRTVLLKRSSPLPRWFALLFLLAACAAIIIALARPQGDAGTRTEKTLGRNVLIALDLSRSMRVSDVKPDRLTQAKMVIYELLESMPNERVGLIGFAGTSYLYAPLTVDHRAVRETVEQIDETWAPLGGSDLAAAIHLAVDTLKKTGQKNNALVILSDGEENNGDLDEMISEAEKSGVFILAIGVGTVDGNYVPNPDFEDKLMHDRDGKTVISRLQPEVMRKLAAETKGRYAVAGTGINLPAMVKESIKYLDAFEMEGRERRISIEFYQWLVLPAIVFLIGSIFAGTRWKGVNPTAAAAALVFLTPMPARADGVSAAKDALQHQRHREARETYRRLADETRPGGRKARFRLGEATAAYRQGEFKHARTAYSRALLSEEQDVLQNAHTGMGNTLFQLGWRSLTEESYPADPAQVPDLGKFDTLVKDYLDKLKQNADPDQAQSGGYKRLESLITNWTDAVRHYDSTLAINPADVAAKNNSRMTMTYLKRLRELMEEDHEETEQSMPQPQPGDCDKPGDGGGKPKKPGDKGPGGEKPQDDKDQGDEKKDDGSGGDKEKEKKDDKPEGKKDGKIPDETPDERARRILKENADLEKGPLTPGRREFRPAEKDW
jgi:Ca-activated chloride channel family protein